jgi:emp24/gp25L/p24 family/GOLD
MPRAFIPLVCVALCASASLGFRFSLEPGTRQCFTEDLPTQSRIEAEVRVADGKGAMEIDVWITTMKGRVLWHKRAPDHGKFVFTTGSVTKTQHSGIDSDDEDEVDYGWTDETYRICLEHQRPSGSVHPPGSSRIIAFHLTEEATGAAKGSQPVTGEAVNTLQLRMRTMHETLSLLITDLTMLQQRERKLVKRVSSTNQHIAILSGFAIAVSLLTALLQYHYYKKYFTQKKLC